MTRRLFIFVLVFTMLLSSTASVFALDFDDVKGHWAEKYIDWVSDRGYLIGDDGLFRPDDKITKAEVVAVMNRLMKTEETKEFSFTDVHKGSWYYEDIGKAIYSGIIDDGDIFMPQSNILREDSMLIIARAYSLEFNEKAVEIFGDHLLISEKGAIGALVDAKIVEGYEDGNVHPTRELSRAEFAKMIRDIVDELGEPVEDEKPEEIEEKPVEKPRKSSSGSKEEDKTPDKKYYTISYKKQLIPNIPGNDEDITDLEGYTSAKVVENGKTSRPADPADINEDTSTQQTKYRFIGWYGQKYEEDGGNTEFDFNTPITKDTELIAVFKKVHEVTYELEIGISAGNDPIKYGDTKEILHGDELGEAPSKEEICGQLDLCSKCYAWGDIEWTYYPEGMTVGEKVTADIFVEGRVEIEKLEEVSVTIAVYEMFIYEDEITFEDMGTVDLRNGNCGEKYSFKPYDVLLMQGIISPVGQLGEPEFHLEEDGLFILNDEDEIQYAFHSTHTIDQEISTPDPLYENTTIILRYSIVEEID